MADPFYIDVYNFIEVTESMPLLRINDEDHVSENVGQYFVIWNNTMNGDGYFDKVF